MAIIVSKNKNMNEVYNRNKNGDCFKVVGDFALATQWDDLTTNSMEAKARHEFQTKAAHKLYSQLAERNQFLPAGQLLAVHGAVNGQGELEGVEFSHGWIEDDILVYDYSDELTFIILKEIYYAVGGIQDKEGKLKRYTMNELSARMIEEGVYGHFGEIITESGY